MRLDPTVRVGSAGRPRPRVQAASRPHVTLHTIFMADRDGVDASRPGKMV